MHSIEKTVKLNVVMTATMAYWKCLDCKVVDSRLIKGLVPLRHVELYFS